MGDVARGAVVDPLHQLTMMWPPHYVVVILLMAGHSQTDHI